MDAMYRLTQTARLLGFHPNTIRSWADEGRIQCVRLGERQERRFPASEIRRLRGEQNENSCILYARVSGHRQRDELARQMETLRAWGLEHQNAVKIVELEDVGSGLNAQRKGLQRLFTLVQQRQVRTVVVTSKDRLTRFGLEYIETLCNSYGVEIVALHDDKDQSPERELVDDFTAIVTSFARRLYGKRSAKAQELVGCVERVTKVAAS